MSFDFKPLEIPDVILIEPRIFRDGRGFFAEIYRSDEFAAGGIRKTFEQINHSQSSKNVLRGLHYQLNPMAQAKLVRVVSGEICDVVVDIRYGSPTYRRWIGTRLNSTEGKMLYIPEGCAHGFCVLSERAEVEYCCTRVYSPAHERGIRYDDPALGIEWPVKDPVISEKDQKHPVLALAENNIVYGTS